MDYSAYNPAYPYMTYGAPISQSMTVVADPVVSHTSVVQTPPSDFVTTTERNPLVTQTRTYSPGRAIASQTVDAPLVAYVGPAYNPPVAATSTTHYEGLDTVTTTHFDGPFGGSSVTTVSGPHGTYTTRNDAFGNTTTEQFY